MPSAMPLSVNTPEAPTAIAISSQSATTNANRTKPAVATAVTTISGVERSRAGSGSVTGAA
jgi:hypothetical protein